jgi:hypothetical protein
MTRPPDPAWIGPYKVDAVLGEGGTGRVFLASGPSGRLFAVKWTPPALAADDAFRARFAAETEGAAQASGIWTPPLADADPQAPVPWAAYQFVPGPTLAQTAGRVGAFPESAALRLAADLAAAVDDLLRRGLALPQITPAHVVLAAEGARLIYGTAGGTATPAEAMRAIGALTAAAAAGTVAPDLAAAPARIAALIAPCLAADPDLRPGPLRFLEAAGRPRPSTRPWPRGVNELAATQDALLHRLLPAPAQTTTRLDLGETMIAATKDEIDAVLRAARGRRLGRWRLK